MVWLLAVAALITGILIWFIVPYSPTKAEFAKLTSYQMTKTMTQGGLLLPKILQNCPASAEVLSVLRIYW